MNVIFFASGFAGLIYESIWTHYLKLFLGHAAYAQTLVLGIFMGGMAIGAAVAARRTARIANPLKLYAGIEIAIGLFAMAFHPVFTATTDGFYNTAFAQGISGTPFLVAKWGLAALLILPQSILLGATFPVFAAAVTRSSHAGTGRSIATLYFANSMGGAIGVLASGFLLIPQLGLPGTMSAAGAVNLLIGAVVAWLAARVSQPSPRMAPDGDARFGAVPLLLVAVSFFTGASSFIYEVGWIRMLSLVLGSATHSFELMLCAFIVGLALGGLWVRKRIDTSRNPGMLLGYVQIAMGIAAIATIPLHSASFDVIAWVVSNASKDEQGYALLNLVRYGVSSIIMFPAAFCAGMTLPLATRILHSNAHQGEKAIGMIYSANTIGAITGLAFAVHIGFPVLGLEYLVASGALVDVLLGVVLLAVFAGRTKMLQGLAATAACIAGTAVAATTINPQRIVSGAFRSGSTSMEGTVFDIAHGRTATISVDRAGENISIRTNGKADASARVHAQQGYLIDEVTMNLIGAVPLLMHDAPTRVANIGFGSGITGEAILSDSRVRQLDTIEIEPRMVELARHFGNLNRAVYDDPRSAVHIDDAKSFFASNGQSYDLIVSEPSNPWVSGVSGLFSVEFYRHVSRYLSQDGIFAQWIHVYESHPDRVTSVIKALDQVFDDYLVVALDAGDILLVAKPRGKVALRGDAFSRLSPAVKQKLQRIQINNQSDIDGRIVGDKAFFRPWLDGRQIPANSDFAPYLDSHADYDRFIGQSWKELALLPLSAYPIAEVLGKRGPFAAGAPQTVNGHFGVEQPPLAARIVQASVTGDGNLRSLGLPPNLPGALVEYGTRIVADCRNPPMGDNVYALAGLAIKVLPYLPTREAREVLDAMAPLPCFANLTGTQSSWGILLQQLADRDARGFGVTAEALLDQGHGATAVRFRYLLGMAVLGHLGAGDRARARAVWEKHGKTLTGQPLGLALEILRDHALSDEKSMPGTALRMPALRDRTRGG